MVYGSILSLAHHFFQNQKINFLGPLRPELFGRELCLNEGKKSCQKVC